MSIVSAIKDSIELLNNVYDSVSGELTIYKLIQETFIFILGSLKNILYYLITFQWLRDFSLLPIIIPQNLKSIFCENFFVENPSSNLFSFLEIPSYSKDKLLIGFLNSFFLSLPITTSHIIAIRTLLIQGNYAGFASVFGIVAGQWFFIICVIFGVRDLFLPWLSLEPLSYFIGIFLVLKILYDMVNDPSNQIGIEFSNKKKLISFFAFHFALAWCEQTCIFQYLGNLSSSAEPTVLENFYSKNSIESVLSHSNYALGLLLGCIFFSGLLFLFLIKLREFFNLPSELKKTTRKRVQFICFTLSMGFTLSSIPFYGLDYLFTGPFGFVSQDQVFQKSIFAQTNLKDTINLLGRSSEYNSLDTDIAPFDRGKYILSGMDQAIDQTFEDLNYRGEYHWTRRDDTVSNINDPRFKNWSQNAFGFGKNPKIESTVQQKILDDSQKTSQTKQENFLLSGQAYMDSIYNLGSRVQDSYIYNQETQNPLETFINFTKSSFSNSFFQRLTPNLEEDVEKKIKQKYYSNPVYQFLLNQDIDFFIKRQPKSFLLNSNHEKDLVAKRIMLANYYDTLRDYNEIPNREEFQKFFNGSKSYADRIYNQQFKGTLRVVRRLFALSFDKTENADLRLVLKYDQPLYKFGLANPNNKSNEATSKEDYSGLSSLAMPPGKKSFFHEELKFPETTTGIENTVKSPFLEMNYPIPFYAGWDEQLRKLVLTNRILPKFIANNQFIIKDNLNYTFSKTYNSNSSLSKFSLGEQKSKSRRHSFTTPTDKLVSKKLIFTAWPLSKNILEKPKTQSNIPYTTLFESFSDPENRSLAISNLFNHNHPDTRDWEEWRWDYSTLPSNLERVRPLFGVVKVGKNQIDLNSILAPQRGGFVWPGNEKLKFGFDVNQFPPKIIDVQP